jgi:hypothetical protein
MDLKALAEEIGRIEAAANKLLELGRDFPAVAKNSVRILASVRMLQINVSDVLAIIDAAGPDPEGPPAAAPH